MKDHFLIPSNLFDLDQFALLGDDKDKITVLWLRLYADCGHKTGDGYPYLSINGIELDDKVLDIINHKVYGVDFIGVAMQKLIYIGVVRREIDKIFIIPPWLKKRDRSSDDYKKWRMSVFERDSFVCRKCGSEKEINAHHIIPWSRTEEGSPLRFDVSNGITLCKDCHLDAHGGCWRNG